MDPDKIEAGLVFVSTKDSLGQIISSISKEEYNYVGFYLNSNFKGINNTKVFVFDIFRSESADWLPPEATLDHICVNFLVTKVVTKKLRGSENPDLVENFKLSIASSLSQHQKFDMIPAIYKLFGHHCDPVCIENKVDKWCGESTMDLINNTFKNMGIWNKFKNRESDKKTILHIKPKTFYADTTYFEAPIEIDLSKYPREFYRLADQIEIYNAKNKTLISEFVDSIIFQMNQNKSFADTVGSSLELTELYKKFKTKI